MSLKEDIAAVGHLAAELAERLENLCNLEFVGNNGTEPEDYDVPSYYETSPLRFKEISTRADQLHDLLQRSPEVADALAAVNPDGVVATQEAAHCLADAERLTEADNSFGRELAGKYGGKFIPVSVEDTKKRITERSYAEAVVSMARMAVYEIEYHGPQADFFTMFWGTKRRCELEAEAAIAATPGQREVPPATINLPLLVPPEAVAKAIDAVASFTANYVDPGEVALAKHTALMAKMEYESDRTADTTNSTSPSSSKGGRPKGTGEKAAKIRHQIQKNPTLDDVLVAQRCSATPKYVKQIRRQMATKSGTE